MKQATLFYEGQESGLGLALLDEIDAVVQKILARSRGIPCLREQGGVELIGFHLASFNQIRSDEILITSVMDLRRDPTRWKELLRQSAERRDD